MSELVGRKPFISPVNPKFDRAAWTIIIFIAVMLVFAFCVSGCGNRAPDPNIVAAQARIYQALATRIEARTAAETPIPPPEFPPLPSEDKTPVPERISEPSFSSRLGTTISPFE